MTFVVIGVLRVKISTSYSLNVISFQLKVQPKLIYFPPQPVTLLVKCTLIKIFNWSSLLIGHPLYLIFAKV